MWDPEEEDTAYYVVWHILARATRYNLAPLRSIELMARSDEASIGIRH